MWAVSSLPQSPTGVWAVLSFTVSHRGVGCFVFHSLSQDCGLFPVFHSLTQGCGLFQSSTVSHRGVGCFQSSTVSHREPRRHTSLSPRERLILAHQTKHSPYRNTGPPLSPSKRCKPQSPPWWFSNKHGRTGALPDLHPSSPKLNFPLVIFYQTILAVSIRDFKNSFLSNNSYAYLFVNFWYCFLF